MVAKPSVDLLLPCLLIIPSQMAGLGYTAYAAQLLRPADWSLYTAALLNGVGGALLWTGQGVFIAANSDQNTASRRAALFWSLYQVTHCRLHKA